MKHLPRDREQVSGCRSLGREGDGEAGAEERFWNDMEVAARNTGNVLNVTTLYTFKWFILRYVSTSKKFL